MGISQVQRSNAFLNVFVVVLFVYFAVLFIPVSYGAYQELLTRVPSRGVNPLLAWGGGAISVAGWYLIFTTKSDTRRVFVGLGLGTVLLSFISWVLLGLYYGIV